ncbi:hypothetical protein H9P43_002279 [Blastocladiella emersonii ATCC 22665]|nr:hypothetical protein H9P43_002279 [Blastocladiella emersonii ATCC 22665]
MSGPGLSTTTIFVGDVGDGVAGVSAALYPTMKAGKKIAGITKGAIPNGRACVAACDKDPTCYYPYLEVVNATFMQCALETTGDNTNAAPPVTNPKIRACALEKFGPYMPASMVSGDIWLTGTPSAPTPTAGPAADAAASNATVAVTKDMIECVAPRYYGKSGEVKNTTWSGAATPNYFTDTGSCLTMNVGNVEGLVGGWPPNAIRIWAANTTKDQTRGRTDIADLDKALLDHQAAMAKDPVATNVASDADGCPSVKRAIVGVMWMMMLGMSLIAV